MPNRALQAKAIKLKKQIAARPIEIDARIITLRDGERFYPTRDPSKARKVKTIKRAKYVTPIFQVTDWKPESRLIKAR